MIDLNLSLGLLKEGLSLWNNREATKYLDQVIRLEKKYNEEISKPVNERSDLLIDSVLLELRTISESFVTYAAKDRTK